MTNEQLQVLKQKTRKQYVKLTLLNKYNVAIAEFIGVVVGGNVNISNKSAFRRSGSISVKVKNQFIPSPTSYVWFDKRVKIEVGIQWQTKGV